MRIHLTAPGPESNTTTATVPRWLSPVRTRLSEATKPDRTSSPSDHPHAGQLRIRRAPGTFPLSQDPIDSHQQTQAHRFPAYIANVLPVDCCVHPVPSGRRASTSGLGLVHATPERGRACARSRGAGRPRSRTRATAGALTASWCVDAQPWRPSSQAATRAVFSRRRSRIAVALRVCFAIDSALAPSVRARSSSPALAHASASRACTIPPSRASACGQARNASSQSPIAFAGAIVSQQRASEARAPV
jgi:hypothetical protein